MFQHPETAAAGEVWHGVTSSSLAGEMRNKIAVEVFALGRRETAGEGEKSFCIQDSCLALSPFILCGSVGKEEVPGGFCTRKTNFTLNSLGKL